MSQSLLYFENKSSGGDRGDAWIGFGTLSRSGRTIYFNGRALKRAPGGMTSGNYYCLETGDEFWISGPKKDGSDRHWAGGGTIHVEARAVEAYLVLRAMASIDSRHYVIDGEIVETDIARFAELENRSV